MIGKTVSLKVTGLILDTKGGAPCLPGTDVKEASDFSFCGKHIRNAVKALGRTRTAFLIVCPSFFNEGPFAVDPM